MTPVGVPRLVWAGAAAAFAVAALAGLVTVLTGPETIDDSNVLYTVVATFLGGSAFFASVALAERGVVALGIAGAIASAIGWFVLTYAIWQDAVSGSDGEGAFWAGIVTLAATSFAVATRLLAHDPLVTWIARGCGVLSVVAAIVSLEAALGHEQFWRVGTVITSLWIVAAAVSFAVPALERASSGSELWFGLAALPLGVGVVGIAALVSGDFGPDGYQIFVSTIAAVLAAAAVVGGIVAVERGATALGWASVAVAPLGLTLFSFGVWADSDERFQQIASGVLLLAAAHVAVATRLFASTNVGLRLANAAGATAGAAALVSLDVVWNDERLLPGRWATALWIVATLACLLVPVVERHLAAPAPAAGAAA